jgi:hypothetical protein
MKKGNVYIKREMEATIIIEPGAEAAEEAVIVVAVEAVDTESLAVVVIPPQVALEIILH